MDKALQQLAGQLHGDLFFDKTMRTLYATDASSYRELPLAVAIPKSKDDIATLIGAGVEFLSEGPAEVAGPKGSQVRFICFKDPDGTVLELVEMG